METRTATSPKDAKYYDTERLREEYLVKEIFIKNRISLIYSHDDRMVFGGAEPLEKPLALNAGEELRASYFLERREMGIINIGGTGTVTAEGIAYRIPSRNGLYLGKGIKKVTFASDDVASPSKFYIVSTPAHKSFLTKRILLNGATEHDYDISIKTENRKHLGDSKTSNERTINKFILPGQVESCQLEMGMTHLEEGSVWNSMPCHTHDRRMEVYIYFDLDSDDFVMHFMGEPGQTRHLVIRNEQAVISPSWSIHCGCGSKNYTFIWAMAGENQDFDDMDEVDPKDLY